MQPGKISGRIIGILFLLIIGLGVTSLNFRGLNSALIADPNFLQSVFEQAFLMRLSVVLNLLAGLLWLGVAIYLFPYIHNISRPLAHWFLSLWVIQICVSLMGDMGHLSLIDLSENIHGQPAHESVQHQTLGKILIHDYFWGHFFGLMGYSAATFLLFVAVYRGKWLPRFIPLWGMAAMTLVFFASAAQLFRIEVSFLFYQQNGLHFIFMTLWLLIFGFKQTAVDS